MRKRLILRSNKALICFIENLLLSGKIDLWEIPQDIRFLSRRFYIYAFRKYRYSKKESYERALHTLFEDMQIADTKHIFNLCSLYEAYRTDDVECSDDFGQIQRESNFN